MSVKKENNSINPIKLPIRFLQLFLKGNFVRPVDVAQSYDFVSRNYDRLFLERMKQHGLNLLEKINITGSPNILDLGCGTGFAISYFKNKFPNCRITGIDFSSKMLGIAKKLVFDKNLTDVSLINSDVIDKIESLPANSYDIVICLWSFDYINSKRLLKEVHRVLKISGQFGIIGNSKETLSEVRRVFWKALLKKTFKMKRVMAELPLPKNQVHLFKLLKAAKFREIKTWQGQEKSLFKSGQEATNWIFNTGALAGYDNIFDIRNNSEILQFFNDNWGKDSSGNITITHKFIIALAKK